MRNTGRIVAIVLGVLVVLLLLGSIGMMGFGGFGSGGMMGGYWMRGPGMMYGWGLGGLLLMLLFWALVIGGIVWLVVTLVRRGPTASMLEPSGAAQTPLDIIKMRYAKGEIAKEQFEEMKRDLGT